jgi:periplasmic divalent cation tolerance protein
MPDADPIVVFITAPNLEEARRLAEMLVQTYLAACVQILPEIESTYRWQGNVERQAEVLLIAKTVHSRFGELESRVRALHSYETPEIVAVPVVECSNPYLEWLVNSIDVPAEPVASAPSD